MKKMLLIICLLGMIGCEDAKPEKSETTENGWKVEKCFEKDGYTVYRFTGGGDWKYYVVPQGEVVNVVPQGKTRRLETIPTIGK